MRVDEAAELVRHHLVPRLRSCLVLCGLLIWNHLRMYFAKRCETAVLSELGSMIEKEVSMNLEKDVKIGDVGDVDFALRPDGKIAVVATIGKKFAETDTEVDVSVKLIQGEKLLMDKMVAALPAGFLREAAQKAEDLELARSAAAAAPSA